MANSTSNWTLDPASFINNVQTDYQNNVKALAIDVLGSIVNHTPVDTGTLRNNTHVSFGQQDSRYIIRDKDNQHEVTALFGGDQAAKIVAADLNNVNTIFIQNNLPYADYVENGTSTQAPKGMFALGVQEATARRT